MNKEDLIKGDDNKQEDELLCRPEGILVISLSRGIREGHRRYYFHSSSPSYSSSSSFRLLG